MSTIEEEQEIGKSSSREVEKNAYIDSIIKQFLNDINAYDALFEKPMPLNYKPLYFNKENRIDLIDIEQLIEGFLLELYPEPFVLGLRTISEQTFPRMRIYEYTIQICRFAEERYLESNKFMEPIVSKWKRTVLSNQELPDTGLENVEEDFYSTKQQMSIKQWINVVDKSRTELLKIAEIFYQICKNLHIPKITNGFPLRMTISILYTLTLDRLDVYDKFVSCLNQINSCLKVDEETVKMD